jgi:hypothetical protein
MTQELLVHLYMKAQERQNEADGNIRWLEIFELRSPISERAAIESKL